MAQPTRDATSPRSCSLTVDPSLPFTKRHASIGDRCSAAAAAAAAALPIVQSQVSHLPPIFFFSFLAFFFVSVSHGDLAIAAA